MEQYLELVETVLSQGSYKPNRTGIDTLSSFNHQSVYNLQDGFPLLTTKRMDGKRWNSLVYEYLWYLSGDVHIKELQKHTSMWNPWTDSEGYLDSSIGRFWRRFPIPEDRLGEETWPDQNDRWVNKEGSFDQIRYVIDNLQENPSSRRLVVNAWHPANASSSRLPPCDYTFVCNIQKNQLNVHLTQRSGDIALGIPFDIARYALLAETLAQQARLKKGVLAHTIVDAHIYCGGGDRGRFYSSHKDELSSRVDAATDPQDYLDIRDWIENSAPAETETGHDHIPGLLQQLSRDPNPLPRVKISNKDIDNLNREDFELMEYIGHPEIYYRIAE